MQNLYKNTLLFAFLSLCCTALWSQSVIVPFGGDATDGSVTVSYTVGQVAVQANSDGSTTIYEGVQQPYEIQIIGIDNYPGITLNAVVFPNPTVGNVELTMNNVQLEGEVRVFDMNGKFLFVKKIEGENTEIPMSDLSAGAYFVNVVNGTQVLKTFKVIKLAK